MQLILAVQNFSRRIKMFYLKNPLNIDKYEVGPWFVSRASWVKWALWKFQHCQGLLMATGAPVTLYLHPQHVSFLIRSTVTSQLTFSCLNKKKRCFIFKSPLISLIHLIFPSNHYSMMAPISQWHAISPVKYQFQCCSLATNTTLMSFNRLVCELSSLRPVITWQCLIDF